uniref:uncharacterized protein LOC104266655 n=1 Tax=Ciona intestinalis TaxID=7719 RepID=UPI00089DBEFE|nr:uncharacterized protein LOC104266655 [Ciona intestinalis]|eukprot:XP_009861701.2 uncharacterized protein LOC104266655 [Ciona intestinalis]
MKYIMSNRTTMKSSTSVCVVLVSIVACAAAARTNQDIKEIAQSEISKNQNSAKQARMSCAVNQYYLASMCHPCIDICEHISTQKECKEHCLAMYMVKWELGKPLGQIKQNSMQIVKLNESVVTNDQVEEITSNQQTEIQLLKQQLKKNEEKLEELYSSKDICLGLVIASLALISILLLCLFSIMCCCKDKILSLIGAASRRNTYNDVEGVPLNRRRDTVASYRITPTEGLLKPNNIQPVQDESNETRISSPR